jgi:hypothetical protein
LSPAARQRAPNTEKPCASAHIAIAAFDVLVDAETNFFSRGHKKMNLQAEAEQRVTTLSSYAARR